MSLRKSIQLQIEISKRPLSIIDFLFVSDNGRMRHLPTKPDQVSRRLVRNSARMSIKNDTIA